MCLCVCDVVCVMLCACGVVYVYVCMCEVWCMCLVWCMYMSVLVQTPMHAHVKARAELGALPLSLSALLP